MKRVMQWALIALVAVGLWSAVQQARRATESPVERGEVAAHTAVTGDVVQVTYFSSNVRCASCVRIERLTRETVARNFTAELASGRVVFRVINIDAPGNAHFVQDYHLISKTVIVSAVTNGQEVGWANLQGVWTKLKDERAFDDYVAEAIRRRLGAAS